MEAEKNKIPGLVSKKMLLSFILVTTLFFIFAIIQLTFFNTV